MGESVSEETREGVALASETLLANGYLLIDQLGGGGMGEVWRARSLGLEREVAVKRLVAATPESQRSLVQEARAVARLNHPAIIQVYDVVFADDGRPFVILELLRGVDLARAIRMRGPLAQETAVDVMIEVLDGLEVAHAQRLVHGDIKPGNIFLAETDRHTIQPKLFDFGLARAPQSEQAGQVAGTPEFMAPEQFAGIFEQTIDQWAACVTLFTAIVGKEPFAGDSLESLCRSIRTRPLPFPRDSEMDPELFGILARGTRKQATDRFSATASLKEALIHWRGSWIRQDDNGRHRLKIAAESGRFDALLFAHGAAPGTIDAQTRPHVTTDLAEESARLE